MNWIIGGFVDVTNRLLILNVMKLLKFRYYEMAICVTVLRNVKKLLRGFSKKLWPSQNISTLLAEKTLRIGQM